jgi:beta-galactosidase
VRQEPLLEDYYRPLFAANVAADFARPSDDLSAYRLVLVPNLYLAGDEAIAALTSYVKGGGTLVMGFFSGVVDPFEHIHLGGYPAPFADMVGLRVADWLPLADGEQLEVVFVDGGKGRCDLWSELIEPSGAEVVASFAGSRVDGRPAVTRHRFGSGTAYYVGTHLDQASTARLILSACETAGVEAGVEAPAGVEAVRRSFGHRTILFLLNHRPSAVDVPLSQAGANLVDGSQVHAGLFRLGPYGAAVIREGW